VFVLSIGDMQCKSVFHLGHKPGTVLAPPTVVRGYMLVAENRGPSTSRVSVISTGPGGTALKRLTTTFELKGRVVATPLTSSSRVIVMTDLGAVYVFEVDPANKRTPVTQVSALTSTETQPLAIFAAVSGGQLFVGDRRLTKYEIQASRGELVRSWPKYEGDEFIAPPQVCGGVVIHARRRAGAPGTTVTASAASDGREVWRTALGAPLAGEAYADAQRRRFIALSGSGQLFEIEQASITAGVVNTPSADLGAKTSSPLAFASRFDLGDGRLAFASRPPDVRLAVYDPSAREILRLTTPKIAAGLACTPVRFQQGLLLPCTDGRIYLIDPASGQELARPAQPPLAPGSTVKWLQPSLLPGGNRFVAADDRRRLYVVEWQPSPEPHLEVVETAEVEVELVTPMVVAGEKILCGARGRSDDSLVSFSLTELKQADELKLEGRIVWGPEVVGESTYVATDRGGLVCASADCRQVWQAPLANAWPAGAPIADDLGLVIALDDGQVRRLDLKSGSPLGEFNLAQPLSGAPVPFAGRLLLTGRDGTLYVVSLPDVAAASATSGS
jgi:outer membrane protein assembly factor BamB